MTTTDALEHALLSERPVLDLRTLVQTLVQQGSSPEAVLADLESLRSRLRAGGREADEDVVLEVMDFVVGFCSPHMRIEGRGPLRSADDHD